MFGLVIAVFLVTSLSASNADAPAHVSGSFLQGQVVSRGQFPHVLVQAGSRFEFAVVELEITVDEHGRVRNWMTVSGHQLFRASAAAYVSQWVFRPFKTPAGQPRAMRGRVSVFFPLRRTSALFGEDLPLVRAVEKGDFEVEGNLLSKKKFEAWLVARDLSSRSQKLHVLLDDPNDAGQLATFLKGLGAGRICFHFDR